MFVVRGTKVAFGFKGSVTVWDSADIRIACMISVPRKMVFMTLSATSNHLVTAHLYDKERAKYSRRARVADAQLEVIRHSLSEADSSPLSREYLTLPVGSLDGVADPELEADPSAMAWTCNRTEALGVLASRRPSRDLRYDHFVVISYDYIWDRVRVRLEHRRPGRSVIVTLDTISVAPDLSYYLFCGPGGRCGGIPQIEIADPDGGPSGMRRCADWMVVSTPVPADGLRPVGTPTHSHLLYGDSDFVVVLSTSGLEVWCFDEISPPNSHLLTADNFHQAL